MLKDEQITGIVDHAHELMEQDDEASRIALSNIAAALISSTLIALHRLTRAAEEIARQGAIQSKALETLAERPNSPGRPYQHS